MNQWLNMGRSGIDEDAGPVDNPEAIAAIRPVTRGLRADPRAAGLASLGMIPGTDAYKARMPQPDRVETVVPDTNGQLILPEALTEAMNGPATQQQKRVAIYTPRQPGVFSVQIEEAPDWETAAAFRIPEDATIEVVKVLRALGVKISDKTGGDLTEATLNYEQRADRAHRKPAPKRAAARQGAGGSGNPDRAPDDQWAGITAEIGALDAPAGIGDDEPGPDGG